MRGFINWVVELSRNIWTDQWSRIWLLLVVLMTALLLIGLFATNPHKWTGRNNALGRASGASQPRLVSSKRHVRQGGCALSGVSGATPRRLAGGVCHSA